MFKYRISGGKPLFGEINISGAKNAAVAIIPATILVSGRCVIENVPKIKDVTLLLEILRDLGAKVRVLNDSTLEIDCSHLSSIRAPHDLVRKIRASYYLIGTLLGRHSHAVVSLPGGCNFGVRPIDQHVKGFESLGASVEIKNGFVYADAEGGLKGANVYLDMVSVGATINIMLAAVLADGLTVIENAAKEPHIVDLANFLNAMGADVKGAGTDVIKIRGVSALCGGTYTIIPDQIEAGTYMAAVTAAGGDVLIKNVIPKHLECITAKLCEMGVDVIEYDDSIRVRRTAPLTKVNLKTLPYPGFPTDMQPQLVAALCLAEGTSIITESVWENRFRYVDELKRMGAHIQVDGRVAIVEGVSQLSGAPVKACDLRAGAAMVIAGLAAKGMTEVEDVTHIERGYEALAYKLKQAGAQIERIEYEEETVRMAQ